MGDVAWSSGEEGEGGPCWVVDVEREESDQRNSWAMLFALLLLHFPPL